jgi:DNA polymerase III epsilon subunit-like protein
MSIKLWGNEFIAIDVETTGLNPELHEITQLAAVVLNDEFKPRADVPFFNIEIRPQYPERASAKALSKSHQTLENLMINGLDHETAVHVWIDWLYKVVGYTGKLAVPVGYNFYFDRDFLIAFMGREGYDKAIYFKPRDVMGMLMYVSDRFEIFEYNPGFTSFGLEKCCEILQVHNERAHDALHDCLATAECAHRLLRVKLP